MPPIFKIDSNTVQQEVCIGAVNFQAGQLPPQTITVIYQNQFSYNYKFSHIDAIENYCYNLIVGISVKNKRKKKIITPCPTICIVGGVNGGTTTPCPNPPSIQILDSGVVDERYRNILQASGGISPYAFTIFSGALPDGLFLGMLGDITGIATTAGTFNFTVKVTDANGCTGFQEFSILINPPPCPTICIFGNAQGGGETIPCSPDRQLLPNGTRGQFYSQQLSVVGGTAPYVFMGTPSDPGITLSPTGLISGIVGLHGGDTDDIDVRVTDANGCPGGIQLFGILTNEEP